jgi:hypothetical protein
MNTPEKDLKQIQRDLMDDYNMAARIHVPGWRGGINPNVAAELVRAGWRKQSQEN